MRQSQLGNLAIAALALLNVLLWALFPPPARDDAYYLRHYVGEVFSTTALILFSCGIFLSLRPRFLEPFFGGLDKMYQSHKSAALFGLGLIGLHVLIIPLTKSTELGNLLGKIAFFGMLALVVLTLAPRLPWLGKMVRLAYHHWKITHQFIGVFFIIGLIHAVNVNNLAQFTPIPNFYGKAIYYAGAVAYLYRELIAPFLARKYAYTVAEAQRVNSSTLEVVLQPKTGKAPQVAGQFAFVRFDSPGLGEWHPFTVSSAPHEAQLRFSIKAGGDWTKHLYATLQPGAGAQVEGCYGQMNYRLTNARQIWVAGGIGITPFLSWVRDLKSEPPVDIDFFYTVRAEADAVFWDEFAAAAQKYPRFRATLNVSSKGGSLTVEKIAATLQAPITDHHVFMCGPVPLVEAFQTQFAERGLKPEQIHFEEFNFR